MANTVESDTAARQAPPYGTERSTPSVAQEATGIARERAGAIWDDAKETARTKLNEQKDAAAAGIGDVAGALRDAARRRQGDGDTVSRLTESAADGLERLSGGLRNKDVSAMLRDMNAFAREQPVAFFGLALAAGFVAVRLMKDSTQ